MSDPVDTFRAEAEEHLTTLEQSLLEMEDSPEDQDLIAHCFRAMHTIKGAGGMFGFDDLSAFTHHLETAFDQVRNGEFPVTPELISVMLDAKDHIAGMLEQPKQTAQQMVEGQSLLGRLAEIIPSEGHTEQTQAEPPTAAAQAPSDPDKVFRIRFTPHAGAFVDGFDVLPILSELSGMGECSVTTLDRELPELADLDAEQCHLSWDLVLITAQTEDAINDVFIFVADDWKIEIDDLSSDLGDEDDASSQIGELLVQRGLISQAQIGELLNVKPKTGELLVQSGLVSESDIQAALAEQNALSSARERKAKAGGNDAIVRVPTSRLDTLMNLVGELVIVQARINQLAQSKEDEEIVTVAEDLDRLTVELRDNTFSIRMLPIGTTFGRFRRLVRDLSRDLGKEIRLETEGAETELDKMVIDRLADPMVHLIRNSIDHGIEAPEQRVAAGKPRSGTIHLSAEHAESHVVIQIRDDGAGLDPQKLRKKAVERGLISNDTVLSDDDSYALIFEPGFSTAKEVTDVSGRGVGMDVVKRSIQDLGGSVAIRSQLGQGVTIKITLPMTLAIIEGLMVAVADERYVLPLSAVEECIELQDQNAGHANSKRLVEIRGELVPFMRLREWFEVPGKVPSIEQVVVTRMGDGRFGFSVDEVIGQYQTVIKRLGKFYEGTVGFAGATILGNGNVAMILDTAGLVEAVEAESKVG